MTSSFLDFHAFAATRGEGLRPELRALFERVAVAPRSELTARNDGMIQSGPDPVPAEVSKERGNVSLFPQEKIGTNRKEAHDQKATITSEASTYRNEANPTQRSIVMKCFIDTHDKNKSSFPEQELTEEQFFEQFAALEDGLALLQVHMRRMSENAKLFGSLARHMRRSICPATLSPR